MTCSVTAYARSVGACRTPCQLDQRVFDNITSSVCVSMGCCQMVAANDGTSRMARVDGSAGALFAVYATVAAGSSCQLQWHDVTQRAHQRHTVSSS